MDVTGSYTLYAPRDRVWTMLLDPEVLRAAMPGCERLEQDGDNRYRVRVNIGVAAVKGVYDGTLRLSDIEPPERYRMTVDGKGARGVLHGVGSLTLEERDAQTTIVHYAGQAQLGGAIAGVGMRVAIGAGNMLIKSFFSRLADILAAPVMLEADVTPDDKEMLTPLKVEPPSMNEASLSSLPPASPASHSSEPDGMPVSSISALSGATADTDDFSQPGQRVATATSPAVARGPLMRLARRSGLTDGSMESERLWARRLLAGVMLAGGLMTVTAVALTRRIGRP